MPPSRVCQYLSLACLLGASLLSAQVCAQPTFTDQATSVLSVGFNSRSASLADIDDDGDLDLMFQRSGNVPRLYRNNIVGTGSFTFSDVSSMLPSGVTDGWSAGWGDYNGDGRIDVFVGQSNFSGSGDVLMNTNAGFINSSVATGLNDPGFHQNLAWNDIDNDRDLDLLIGMEGPFEKHEIYLQGPAGSFTPVGAAAGFQADLGTKAYGMAIGDTDGDGDLDVYLSTCRIDNNVRNNFYQNMLIETGDLGFVDIADTNGTQTYYQDARVRTFANSYGAEFHDFDDDGDLDLFVTGADGMPSKIFRNDGGNMFTDVDEVIGHPLLSDTGGDLNGSRAIDYDNDGDLDLFMHDHLQRDVTTNNARKLYRNDGGWQFTDVTAAEGIAETNLGSYDSTWGDLDLDGDQDLVATTDTRANERFFISKASENGNHWLYVSLAGPTDNTTGIGASIYATINAGTPEERTLRRGANTNGGTFNQSDLPIHFGLGPADHVDELSIHWPGGTIQTLLDVAANQYLTVNTPGDFNGDGKVDSADVAQWQTSFGVDMLSDSDYDGDADGADYLFWQRQFGNGLLAAAAPATMVPEPTAAHLVLFAAATSYRRAGRRNSR